jgi:hypothetical protein
MNWSQNRLALLVALLLVGSAALFGAGTAIEHHQRGEHHQERSATVSPAANSGETSAEKKAKGESSGETKPAESASSTVASGESGGETQSEKIAGVDPESWPLVGLAIAISLLVAAAVYWRRGRWLAAAVGFGVLFAAGDIRELVHQIQESRATVATIAGILIALHLLVAAAAAFAIWLRGAQARAPEPS